MSVDLTTSFGEIIDTPSFFPTEEGIVEVIVTNQGDMTFNGSADLALYASIDSRLEKNDLNIDEEGFLDILDGQDEVLTGESTSDTIGTITIEGLNLAPGQSETVTLDFSSPDLRTASVVAPGAYFLIAEVDPNNIISENGNDNNTSSQFISTDGSNVVQDWNSVYLSAIQASGADAYGYTSPDSGDGLGTIPPVVPRNGALLHTAIFDTVLAFEGGFDSFAVDAIAPGNASVEAAVVGAAFTVLSSDNVFSNQAAFVAQRDRSLAEIDASNLEKMNGFEFGASVAQQLLELRSTDFAVPPSEEFEPPNQPGTWRPSITVDGEVIEQNPEGPQFESVPPFFIPSTQQFRTDGPPQFGSPRFANETEETRVLGALEDTDITQITRTNDQTEIAQFWSSDRTDTFRPPGHWNLIAQEAILQNLESGGEDLSLIDTARLFAQLNIALVDAGVVSWDSKFDFAQIRPEQTINADPANGIIPQPGFDFSNIDGNPTSIQDPDWDPLIGTPPFPDYTSGHATFGAAAAEVLESVFGDDFAIDITTPDIPGLTRSFDNFTQAAIENGDSRVFGGIHIISSSIDGLEAGQDIGQFVVDNALAPIA
ncbi:MAG: hypothetical protein AAGF26_07495 [Cyanobacteria bacterium P01_G01_bin.49]